MGNESAYVWDTNIAVYYLQQQLPPYVAGVMDEIAENSRICFSVVTEIELFSWKSGTQFDFDIITLFVDVSVLLSLNKEVRTQAADLRRRYNLEMLDAIVVATAFVHQLTLITNNTTEFARLENLRMLNPFDPQ